MKKTTITSTRTDKAWKSVSAHLIFWIVFTVSLFLDLATKSWAFASIKPDSVLEAIPGWIHFRITLNEGAVFGLGSGGRWIFVGASIFAMIFIIRLFANSGAGQKVIHVLLALVLGGAIGNLYDRIVYHAVRDFIEIAVNISGIPVWPYIFNVADVFLVIGIAGLIIGWITGKFTMDYSCPMARPISAGQYKFTEYFEKEVLRKRPYIKKDWCIRIVKNPVRSEAQEKNRFRFWGKIEEFDNHYFRVVTLEDKITIHNAFPDGRFKL